MIQVDFMEMNRETYLWFSHQGSWEALDEDIRREKVEHNIHVRGIPLPSQ